MKYVLILALSFACRPVSAQVLIHFSAPARCQPCREMKPEVARAKSLGADIREVNVDEQKKLAADYHVTAIPTTVCVIQTPNGTFEVGRIKGYATCGQLLRLRAIPVITTVGAASRNAVRALFCNPLLEW